MNAWSVITSTVASRADRPRTSHRTFRIPDDLYLAALAKATERGETLTSVVCKALERYLRSTG